MVHLLLSVSSLESTTVPLLLLQSYEMFENVNLWKTLTMSPVQACSALSVKAGLAAGRRWHTGVCK